MPLTEHDVASADKLRELELKAEHGHAEVFTALASSSRDGEPFMTFRGACVCAAYTMASACEASMPPHVCPHWLPPPV